MDWSNEIIFKLIEKYKTKPCLWDPTDGNYKITKKKYDAWLEIAESVKCDVNEVKKKMNSLLTSFRRERQKEKDVKSGSGLNEKYKSTWFAFKSMSFLLDKFLPRETTDTACGQIEKDIMEHINENETNVASATSSINPVTSQRKEFKSPKKVNFTKRQKCDDPRVSEAYDILKATVANNDDCSIFGEHVACKLRQYSRRTKNIVQHYINDILFDADMGKFDTSHCAPSNTSSPLISPSSETSNSTFCYSQDPQSLQLQAKESSIAISEEHSSPSVAFTTANLQTFVDNFSCSFDK